MAEFPRPPQPVLSDALAGCPTNRNTPPSLSPMPSPTQPPKHITAVEATTYAGPEIIDIDEVDFILKTCLLRRHYNDPNVIRFISLYVQYRDIKQAAKESGFTYKQGYHIRTKPDVHQAIVKLTEKAVLKYGLDPHEIVGKVLEILNVDLLEFENPDGSYKTSLSQVSPETRRAIKKFTVKNTWGEDPNGMKIVTGQIISVEVWDKLKSAELLGRESNLFKETKITQHDVSAGMKDLLLQSRERAEQSVIDSRKANTEVIDVGPTEKK